MPTITPTPTYSDAPAARIDLTPLPNTRFVEGERRKYPYRDQLGRVNLNLVNASLAEAEVDGAQETTLDRLRAWQRHAVRNLSKRPKDELVTLDDLLREDDNCAPSRASPTASKRLFRAPKADDEPLGLGSDDDVLEADRAYLCRVTTEGATKRAGAATRRARRLNEAAQLAEQSSDDEEVSSTSGSAERDSDVYEVEAVLAEDEAGGRGFLIRWAGYSADHDSWEQEWDIAPHLVADFRKERSLAWSHVGDDYVLGRKRMLWCATCDVHYAHDSFSAQQRRVAPYKRACLVHHYRSERPSSMTATPVATRTHASATSPPTTVDAASTPARLTVAGYKRARDGASAATSPAAGLRLPSPPVKAPRPIARALSQRQAAMEMRTARLFGFGSL